MESKKVSVIIPCFNQGEYIADSIESVINQTYKNIEIVIVNDGSTDNSSEIINDQAKKYDNILFLDEKENQGVVNARNLAVEKSSGEYILPLDADDTIEPTYVEKAVKILDENPDIGIVYCKARLFGTKNEEWILPKFDINDFLYDNCIFCTALFRKSDFLKVNGYNKNMQYGYEDWDLWMSLVENGVKVYRINEILFNYRQYETTSRNDICHDNHDKTLLQIFKNHTNLYLNQKDFPRRVFGLAQENNYLKAQIEQLKELIFSQKKKLNKNIRLFNIMLIVAIIEAIIITGFVLWRIYG